MTTMTIEQAVQSAKDKIAAIKANAAIQRQLKTLTNEKFLEAKASLEIKQDEINTLNSSIDVCKGIIDQIPVYDNRTKQNKKWSGSSNFNFDIPVQLLTNLCGNVQYANSAHKQLMLASINLPELLVIEINRLFTQNSRYSSVQEMILSGTAGTTEEYVKIVSLAGDYLGIEFDTTQFAQSNLDRIETKALVIAERMETQHDEAKLLYQKALSL